MKQKMMMMLLAGMISYNAYAQREVGNGGDGVVPTDGAVRLRDLVDPGNCTWRSGKSILAMYPDLPKIIEKVKTKNPYFGFQLEQQIRKIKWCFTATLKQINTNDEEEALTYYVDPYAKNKIQAGIRVVNTVYINQKFFTKKKAEGGFAEADKPFFFIHESMHAFLPMKTEMRNKRVKDAVKGISDYYSGVTNDDDFDTMIDGASLLIPSNQSVVQQLSRVLMGGTSMTLNERVQITSPILNPRKLDLAERDEVLQYISSAQMNELTELTGFSKFQFLDRTRDDLIKPLGELVFKQKNAIPLNILKGDLGKCKITLNEKNDSYKTSCSTYYFSKSIPGSFVDRNSGSNVYTMDSYFHNATVNGTRMEYLVPTSSMNDSGACTREYSFKGKAPNDYVARVLIQDIFEKGTCDFTPAE